MKVMQ